MSVLLADDIIRDPFCFEPGRLWSVWDMVELEVSGLVEAIQKLSSITQAIKSGPDDRSEFGVKGLAHIVAHALAGAETMIPIARKLDLDATELSAERLADLLRPLREKQKQGVLRISEVPLQRIEELAAHTTVVARDQLSKRFALMLSSKERELYEAKEPPFGEAVSVNFPSATDDIEDAAKCIALGRYTASVLLLMRGLEHALAVLEKDVMVSTPKEQWHHKIDQIEAAVKAMGKGTHSRAATKDEQQWYSEAATHFRFIKDAWRNYAAHGKARYDEQQARRIYENVQSFMSLLAQRLKE